MLAPEVRGSLAKERPTHLLLPRLVPAISPQPARRLIFCPLAQRREAPFRKLQEPFVPATGALASGLATEPAFAGTLGGAFAPGLDTGAGIFGGTTPGGVAGANAASPLDTAAYPSGPVGAPSGATANPLDNLAAGTTPSGSPIGTTGSVPTSAGASAVAPPAGVNAPVDATSAAAVPAAGGAAPAAGATPGASGGSFLDKLLSGATTSLTKNPLGTALAAGGLAYNITQGNKQSAAVQALEAQAASQAAAGTTLQSYLQNGTLPPAIQAQLTQATAAAKARILANYANTPGGADPTKNSALAQELNNLNIQAIASASQVEQQLLASGISESGLASNSLTTLANIDQAQSARVGQSIANFAAALSGGSGTTIKLTT